MVEEERERCEFACSVLYTFVNSKDSRLKYGAERRREMQKALEAGQKVEGYRAEWIIETMHAVIKALAKSANKFNNTYFFDYISTDDMGDVLTSAMNRLKQPSKDKKKKD